MEIGLVRLVKASQRFGGCTVPITVLIARLRAGFMVFGFLPQVGGPRTTAIPLLIIGRGGR